MQAEVEGINKTIQATKLAFANGAPNASAAVTDLELVHHQLDMKIDELYSSLNIHDSFHDLDGIDLPFIRTLLLARDLKINIRKRCIGSFFEWDKLDRAMGGRQQALGKYLG